MASAAKRLGGKVVVLTGASGPLGRALVQTLAPLGCRLGLLGRDGEALEPSAGAVASADFRRGEAVAAGIAALAGQLGPVDVLILGADARCATQAAAPDLRDIEEMLEVNYLSGVYAIEAVLPGMLARGSGQLVGLSSLTALRGMVSQAGYSATKAATAIFLESLRPPLGRRKIAVTTCYLGSLRTSTPEGLPLGQRLVTTTPDQAAAGIVRAMVRRRREAYVPWSARLAASVLRRLPIWAFDAAMARRERGASDAAE